MSNKSFRNRIIISLIVAFPLAVVWVGLTASLTVGNFLAGLAFGFLVWSIAPLPEAGPRSRDGSYAGTFELPTIRPLRFLRFGFYFVYAIIEANFQMAEAVLRSVRSQDHAHLKPAILAYPTRLRRAHEITLLANWITLTPGTLTLDVSPDGKTLYIHTFDMGESREAFEAEIARLEQRVEELLH